MKLPAWKSLRWAAVPMLLLGGAGCSGINASHSVSPLDFFLPGVLKADPPPPSSTPAQPETEVPALVAQAH